MFDAAAIGELLIDFTPAGTTGTGMPQYEQNPGGAPGNVMAALAKFGMNTAFIGKVGDDFFGRFLLEVLDHHGVDRSAVLLTREAPTSLAFVHLGQDGDRSFHFYRNPGADTLLRPEEVDVSKLENSRLFHFGSVSMTHEPSAGATLQSAKAAKEKGVLVSYDPNLRPLLWPSLELAKERILEGMRHCQILKVSEEELLFLTGSGDPETGSRLLWETYGILLIFVTLGPEGCFFRRNEDTGAARGYQVNAQDTTGAGDAFFAGVLYRLLQSSKTINEFSPAELTEIASFGNACGALTTTRKGAIPALPALDEVVAFIGRHGHFGKNN